MLAAFLVVACFVTAFGAVRYRQNRADEARREQTRLSYENRELERDRDQFFSEVEHYFPWIHDPLHERLENGEAPEVAFWSTLAEAPALELGTTFLGLPALLPLSEHGKHLYVVGKTGSGKTTLLLNLIGEDLEAGRSVVVVAPEANLFRDWLLPLVPSSRADSLVYFAPGLDENPVAFNPLAIEPGENSKRSANELLGILKRAFGDDELGRRAAPILGNAFACLVGRPHATLWDLKRLLLDQEFRERVAGDTPDPYIREFWLAIYPEYPKGAHLPLLNRLDQFLRPHSVRRALCHPVSSFSLQSLLNDNGILFLDLSHLDAGGRALLGQLFLSVLQLQLTRRDAFPEESRQPVHLYVDEFQALADDASGMFRELLSRGRKFGLSLTLAHQHPSQIPKTLYDEIVGNVASIVSFGVGAKDADLLRGEFLEEDTRDFGVRAVDPEILIGLKVGHAVARLGVGAFAIPLLTRQPSERPDPAMGIENRRRSWERYGIPAASRKEKDPSEVQWTRTRSMPTRAAPQIATGDGVRLGTNRHGDKEVAVALSEKQRTQHLYVIGSSGTGKSTLLLNLIVQGMERGEGLAVLDPHGDLIDQVLSRVPETRETDVVIVDPADRDFPVGFNVLDCHSDLEKELLGSDLVDVFRRLSVRWGDQMNSVLANAILAFLESDRGGTLPDLRRFLVEPEFRESFLTTVKDPDVVYYWDKEFRLMTGRPQAPLLSRLDTFLRPKLIRNMVSQKESRLDFASIMDSGRIFLAKLSQGAIGEGNAYLLGSLLVSKFYQLAIARQAIEETSRRPFYLYIDECHNFLTPSMASILAGARKYRLGLILAHQELQQVSGRDADVLSAVITNPYTRVCFRLGDADAVKLAKGFSHFNAEDLQSLGVGDAICRVERADFDFNLTTAPIPAIDPVAAKARQMRLVSLSRERYGTNRADLEAEREPRKTREPEIAQPNIAEPQTPLPIVPAPASRAPAREPDDADRTVVREPVISTPGRGGQRHKYLQSLIKRWGESHGYRATIERSILNGAGSVDVALESSDHGIAVEISVTSSPAQELAHIRGCLDAGFTHVIALSENTRNLEQLSALLDSELDTNERTRVQCLTAEFLFTFLGRLGASRATSESTVRGYHVSVKYEPTGEEQAQQKKKAIADVVTAALKRMKE